MAVRWSDVHILLLRELRSAFRDRTIVINSIVLPLVLYPLLLWAIFSGITFVRGQTDDMVSRVALVDRASRPHDLAALLGSDERFTLTRGGDEAGAARGIRDRDLDAVLVVEDDAADGTTGLRVRALFDGARERSSLARQRALEIVDRYRQDRLRREALDLGVTPARWTAFGIDRRNTASGRDMGAFLLGLLLPLFFVVMVALGCLNPAIDTTAGERERGTWETLMTTAASLGSIVTAKYLAVTILGGLAGLLNLAAMLLTMRGIAAPLTGRDAAAVEFGLTWTAVPVLVAGAVLLAGFLAAGMMVLAAFARTFREGQSMVTPFYLAAVLPVMFLSAPGLHLTTGTALIPVVNIALAARDAIGGTIRPAEFALAAAATLVSIALLLKLATMVLAAEDVIVGTHRGSLASFLRQRFAGRGRSAATRRVAGRGRGSDV